MLIRCFIIVHKMENVQAHFLFLFWSIHHNALEVCVLNSELTLPRDIAAKLLLVPQFLCEQSPLRVCPQQTQATIVHPLIFWKLAKIWVFKLRR